MSKLPYMGKRVNNAWGPGKIDFPVISLLISVVNYLPPCRQRERVPT